MPEKTLKIPKQKPQLTIYSDDLPELKNFSIDGNYILRVCVNVKRLGKGDEYEIMDGQQDKRMYARCEITSVEMDGDKEVLDTPESFAKKKASVHDNRKI